MSKEEQFIDSLLSTPQLYGVFASPDAKWVAWTWTNVGPHEDVYIAPTDGSADPIKITDFRQNTFISSWTEDGNSLIVKHDYDGDERYRIYKVDIDSKKITPLTEEHPEYFIRGGSLHPNDKYLVYGANYDFKNNKVIEPTIIYRHDLETGERFALSIPKKPGYTWPELNKSGTHIIYQRNDLDPSGVQIWLVDIDGKENREILNFGNTSKVGASWFPDGENVLFLVESGTYRKVGIYNIANANTKWVLDDPSRNIEGVYVPDNSKSIVIIETENAQGRISLIDIDSLKETRLDLPNTLIPIIPITDDKWTCRYFNSQQPTDIVIYSLNSKEISRNITNVFEKVNYKQSDLCFTGEKVAESR